MDNEKFSNPLAPASSVLRKQPEEDKSQPLTNSDFRKLMMTPRVLTHSASSTPVPGSVRGSIRSKHFKQPQPKSETNEIQKKKKKFYETHRKPEDDVLNELNKKYRDRAKERRENGGSTDQLQTKAYHAVGPATFDMDTEERRKQVIQESKYLGGDMEHTHLVKGLDYVLLQKVKNEIQTKEEEEEYREQLEKEIAKREEEQKKKSQAGLGKLVDISFDDQDHYAIKSKFGENILKIVHKKVNSEKNELFVHGRMSYHYNLADDFSESDIPMTIILSKAEVMNNEAYNSISTNKIVIDKLIQIWSNLRTEGNSKKIRKGKIEMSRPIGVTVKDEVVDKEDNIYDDIDDYVPVITKRGDKDRDEGSNDTSKGASKSKHSYFENEKSNQFESDHSNKRTDEQRALELAANVIGSMAAKSDNINSIRKRARVKNEPDSYAECYPGAPENDDAIIDSDDEADYSKMDTTKKKGAVNRWDFDTPEEYSDYMSNREAVPKAAYQYGVKSNDNRSNKKGKKEEKAKLDRDLQKINAIIAKRKEDGQDIGLNFMSERKSKKSKNEYA